MADNVTITPGAGATVSTDEKNFGAGNVQVQLIGIVSAEDGQVGRAKVDANGALLVDVTGVSSSIKQSGVDLVKGGVAAALPATPLANRKSVLIQNMGDTAIRVGASNVTLGVLATRGVVVPSGQSISLDVGTVVVYGIAAAGGIGANDEVNVLEIA